MSSGGEQPKPKRQTSRKLVDGVEPILIPANTNDDISQPIRMNTDSFLADDRVPPRSNTSSVRFDLPPGVRNRTTGSHQPPTAIPPRRQQARPKNVVRYPDPMLQEKQANKFHMKPHWLIFIGIGMVILLVLWVLGSAALAWGKQRLEDAQYGYPRTYQTDAVVGHGDSAKNPSHFIAMNLHRQAVVIEFASSDPTKASTYLTPVFIAGANGDLAPVTLEFRDVNGDGKADMLIHIHLEGQDQVSVFINDGAKFRPSNGTDKLTL